MFNGNTVIERVNHDTYRLVSTLSFTNSKYVITVKPGVITDGASIPRFAWSLIGCPLSGKYVGSAIIHDALYDSQILSRQEADRIFYDMLLHNGVSKFIAKIIYYSVRLFGSKNYNGVDYYTVQKSLSLVNIDLK